MPMDVQETATEAAPQFRAEGRQGRGGGATVAQRPARCFVDEEEEELPTTTAAAAGRRCRSCAAVAIADCVALGCCPCAVVSLLGLALVKAPLVVGRRCVGRLWRRRRLLRLLHEKRVRDVAASAASAPATTTCDHEEKGGKPKVVAPGDAVPVAAAGTTEAELAWLEEMYRVGHWGFGRVSFSGETP